LLFVFDLRRLGMRRSTAFCCSLLLFVTVIGTFHFGWGQEVTASITGTVTDQRGAAVAWSHGDGNVTGARFQTYTALTNDSGLYRIAQLPVGTYASKSRKPDLPWPPTHHSCFTLNQVARVDVAMKVGQTSETVEVTGAAPVLATETTQVDTVMNAATNDNLPLASRNYVQLTLLAPGSVSTDPSSFNNGNNTAGYGGRPLINGNREQANNFMLDGMDNNQVSDNLAGLHAGSGRDQEFNLITNNAPAEFGNFEGGIVNATIKSGTNAVSRRCLGVFPQRRSEREQLVEQSGVPSASQGCAALEHVWRHRSAGRSSRTNFSSSPTIRISDSISQARRVETRVYGR
jgi:hypothetical protein